MRICETCGKEISEGVALCECEKHQLEETDTNENPVEPPVETPATEAPGTSSVVPMESDVSVDEPDNNGNNDDEYFAAIKNCKIINILVLIIFAEGIVSLLLINSWMAAILFLVAEIFVLVPNTKVQKICKAKNPTVDKKSQQAKIKETTKRLKSKDKNFKISFVIAIVCLVCLIVSFIIPSPLIGKNNNNKNVAENNVSVSDTADDTTEFVTEKVTELTTLEAEAVYFPTIDEFVEDYSAKHSELVSNISCRTEYEGENAKIYVSIDGREYMTIDCLTKDGVVYQVTSNLNIVTLCQTLGLQIDVVAVTAATSESLFPAFVMLGYQNPAKYSDLDDLGNLQKNIGSAANRNQITETMYGTTETYEHCVIMYNYVLNTGDYSCCCTIFNS